MTLGYDESLQDYEERFQLSYKTAMCTLDTESLNLVLLRGVREDLLDTIKMLARGDIYQLPYENIMTVFRNHSRAARKNGRSSQPMVSHPLPIHSSWVKLETCWRISRVRCCKPFPYRWTLCTLREYRRKQKYPQPFFALDAQGGTLGMNVH